MTTTPVAKSTPSFKVARTRELFGLAEALSSDGRTVYMVDFEAGTCECPAGQRGVRCYHLTTCEQRYGQHDGAYFISPAHLRTVRRRPTAGSGTVIDARHRFTPDDTDPTPPAAPAGVAGLDLADTIIRLSDTAAILRQARTGSGYVPFVCLSDCEPEAWFSFGAGRFCSECGSPVLKADVWHRKLVDHLRTLRHSLPMAA